MDCVAFRVQLGPFAVPGSDPGIIYVSSPSACLQCIRSADSPATFLPQPSACVVTLLAKWLRLYRGACLRWRRAAVLAEQGACGLHRTRPLASRAAHSSHSLAHSDYACSGYARAAWWTMAARRIRQQSRTDLTSPLKKLRRVRHRQGPADRTRCDAQECQCFLQRRDGRFVKKGTRRCRAAL